MHTIDEYSQPYYSIIDVPLNTEANKLESTYDSAVIVAFLLPYTMLAKFDGSFTNITGKAFVYHLQIP